MTFAFPKKQHLAQRDVISALASRGKVQFKYPIKAYWLPRRHEAADAATEFSASSAAELNTAAHADGACAKPLCSRYVFSVPKKSFKRAVKRNLLKRRMREAVRLNQAECLDGFCADYLLVYVAKDICDYSVIEAAVRDILSKSRALDTNLGGEMHKGKPAVNTSQE